MDIVTTTDKLTDEQTIKLIEDLLLGQGAEDFQLFEKALRRFCPFEAIGMIHQEIRHAHFLSYILDPNRPHPFKDAFLKALLFEISSQAESGQLDLRPIDIHFFDCSNALVFRERGNIDLLIEIPGNLSGSDRRGLVITIEMKIFASESKAQLAKYRKHVLDEYPIDYWRQAFVFLTLDAIDPSLENIEAWIPLSLLNLIDRLDVTASSMDASGKALELYKDYSAMIRRRLVEDDKLAQIAKKIWTKHRTALEMLYEYWPDLQAEIMDWLSDNVNVICESVKAATGYTLRQDTSGLRILRFIVTDWQKIEGFGEGDKSWVSSGALMAIELADWGKGRLKLSFVLGPGNAEFRNSIYTAVLSRVDSGKVKVGRRTAAPNSKWKHLSGEYVQTEQNYLKAEEAETTAEEAGTEVIKKITKFLKSHLEVYHDILTEGLGARQ